MRKTTPIEKEVMQYLNVLRDSGVTNMFGAAPYVQEEFGLDRAEARRVLTLWMDNFNEEAEYGEVKE
jgi:hypothetical protein